jgi:hypothetical protein
LSHLTTPEDILGRYSHKIRFSPAYLSAVGLSQSCRQHFELYCVIICFQVLQWIFHSRLSVRQSDLVDMCNRFSKT